MDSLLEMLITSPKSAEDKFVDFLNFHLIFLSHRFYFPFFFFFQLDWQRDGVFFKEDGHVEELLNAEAERVILEHDEEKPLFLYFAHLAAHSGYQGLKRR